MAMVLRQSTQIKVRIGPFVDATDAVTPETGITLGAADQAEALKANGAATADISGNTWAAVTGADGWYDLTLTTTDTNTVGELIIVVQDASVCLAVFQRFAVIEEAAYDAIYAASAAPATAAGVSAVETDTQDIQSRLPAALVSGRMDASVGAMAANVITAAATAADFTTEVTAGLSTLDAAGVRTAVGLASANLDTQLSAIAGYIDTEVASVLAAVDTEVAAIKTKTDQLTFGVANVLDANVEYVNAQQISGAGTAANPWGPA